MRRLLWIILVFYTLSLSGCASSPAPKLDQLRTWDEFAPYLTQNIQQEVGEGVPVEMYVRFDAYRPDAQLRSVEILRGITRDHWYFTGTLDINHSLLQKQQQEERIALFYNAIAERYQQVKIGPYEALEQALRAQPDGTSYRSKTAPTVASVIGGIDGTASASPPVAWFVTLTTEQTSRLVVIDAISGQLVRQTDEELPTRRHPEAHRCS